MVKKSRKSLEVRELERKLNKAVSQSDYHLASNLSIALAEEYRQLEDFTEAIKTYEACLSYSGQCSSLENAVFAHRAIAELSIEASTKNDAKALKHGEKCFEVAQKWGKIHLIQLAYHVFGWIQFQIYLDSGATDKELLNKSKIWCEKGLAYLDRNAALIDKDDEAVRIGQDSRARKARLRQVLSQIYDKLNNSTQAMYHHNAAFAYAVRYTDYDLQYRCLLSKLNFSGDQRLKTAVDLVHVASNLKAKEYADSKFILIQEKIRARDLEGAKWDMVSVLSGKDFKVLDAEEQLYFQQCMVAVYKTVERLRQLPKLSLYDQMKTYEKIADEFIELDFREVSLDFYKKMLVCAAKPSDRIKALVSVAETAKELGKFEEAFNCFTDIETIEQTMAVEDKKRAETAICILAVAAKIEHMSRHEVKEWFEKAEKLVVTKQQKCDLYGIYLGYLEDQNCFHSECDDIRKKYEYLKNNLDEGMETLSDRDDSPESWTDVFENLTSAQILARCEEEATQQNLRERMIQEKDKKINAFGETRMHEAAKGNDTEYLKLLIKLGYNINARDEGGWTPLHEAIGALKLDNVRVLVQAGACLDIRSNEGTLSAEGEMTDSGGLTPLMEACDRGSTAIASILLKHGANVTLRNKDNWTALDFFRNAIQVGMVEEEDMPEANKFISLMEMQLRQAKVPIHRIPPPKKLLAARGLQKKANIRKENVSPPTSERELIEYRKAMRKVGRGDVHERSDFFDTDEKMDKIATEIAPLFFSMNQDESPSQLRLLDPQIPSTSYADNHYTICNEPLLNNPVNRVPMRKRSRLSSDRSRHTDKRKIMECFGSDSEDELRNSCDSEIIIGDDIAETGKRKSFFSQNVIKSIESPATSSSFLSTSQKNTGYFMPTLEPGPPTTPASQAVLNINEMQKKSPQTLLFVKLVFKKLDGTKIKIKGVPFCRETLVSEIRHRCYEELSAEGEVSSLSIRQGDCELSDETPIGLVLDGTNNILECVVGEVAKLTPLQVYVRKAKVAKSNIVRALNDATKGTLNLADCCIEKEGEAICSSLSAFPINSLSELDFSGNVLSTKLIKVISHLIRHVSALKLESCALDSQNIEDLLGDRSLCIKLSHLNMSYNDIGGISSISSLPSLLKLCPSMRFLRLCSCNINDALLPSLLDALKSFNSLEYLSIRHNQCVNSDYVTNVMAICPKLKTLDVSNTSFSKVVSDVDSSCQLERFHMSFCNISNDLVVNWVLKNLDSLTMIDFSYTKIKSCDLELIVKQKETKLPKLTIKLLGCLELEADRSQFIMMLESCATTNMTVSFQFSTAFRELILSSLHNFSFCMI